MKKKSSKQKQGVTRREFFKNSAAGLAAAELAGASAAGGKPVPSPAGKPAPGTLRLTVVDAASGQPTPTRIELLDGDGKGYVAEDALPIDGDCSDRVIPADYNLERAIAVMSKEYTNPFTKTTQFYSVGNSEVMLSPGDYTLTVRKGPEYELQKLPVHINSGERQDLTVKMTRWIDMPAQGWWSADDHLHIARPVKELNPFLSKWMQAEDIHVANLLQWGLSRCFHNTLQYAFGEDGLYREGDYILATGQENPRTHFLGHTIILGGKTPINFPEAYVIFRLFWEAAERQGALKGYAHFAHYHGAEYGLAIDLHGRLLNFLEILQFENCIYDVWYDVLNMGFRMTPTAGTDFPCGLANYPGRERFYTKIEGPLSNEAWLEGIRKGRTFVTNGAMLDFQIDGKGIGDEILLKKRGTVTVEGRARFNRGRDIVERVEVVVNGDLVRSFPTQGEASEIRFQFPYEISETSWVGLRATGRKTDEPMGRFSTPWGSPSLAHTAPIYVTVEGTPPLQARAKAKTVARAWLVKLEDLEARLQPDQYEHLAVPPYGDGVDVEHIRNNREQLLQAIQTAQKYFREMATT